jgi:hypothetical protein
MKSMSSTRAALTGKTAERRLARCGSSAPLSPSVHRGAWPSEREIQRSAPSLVEQGRGHVACWFEGVTTRPRLLLAALPLLTCPTACRQAQCDIDAPDRCLADDVLQSCVMSYNTPELYEVSCSPGVCVTQQGEGFCSPSADPQPACDGIEFDSGAEPGNQVTCFENAPSGCVNGYVTEGSACLPAETCAVAPPCEPACAFCNDGTYVADPACSGGVSQGCDADDTIVACMCGYRDTSIQFGPCPQGQHCVPDHGWATCG